MKVVLISPPLCQLNTPYPAVPFLTRSLRRRGVEVVQRDLGMELFTQVVGPDGLAALFEELYARAEAGEELPELVWSVLARADAHLQAAADVFALLTRPEPTVARRLLRRGALPPTPRLEGLSLEAFGRAGLLDRARYLATRYLADLADLVASTVEPGFALASYQHHLALGAIPYDPLARRLAATSWVDARLDALVDEVLADGADLVGVTAPFPGTLYGALRVGQRARSHGVPVLLGGGYVSTELREVDEPRLFDAIDGLVLDDGEGPLWAWIEHQQGGPDRRHRTRTQEGLHEAPAPAARTEFVADTRGLPLDGYLQVVDSLSSTHRLWGDGCWHKVMLAHGCYWKRCAFCDVNLDYVGRYEPALIAQVLDELEAELAHNGLHGVHLVDEAAPPRALRAFALGLLARGMRVSWWGNIRFERAFTPDLCRLLAASGCVAVTGGLEVASDRLLALMDKGITVDQAALASRAFTEAGIGVHAYLMYGFPSETLQETVDAAEVVRQLFARGWLRSGFWHRFVVTRGSEVARDPARFGVTVTMPEGVFAANDLPHVDPVGVDPDTCDAPLATMLEAWLRGEALDRPVHHWFAAAPPTTVPADRFACVEEGATLPKGDRQLIWLGGTALSLDDGLWVPGQTDDALLEAEEDVLDWVAEVLEAASPDEPLVVSDAFDVFPGVPDELPGLWATLNELGLLAV